MATTTTNFGWDIPQSTDLVKDGATAIAALGQDIDTAFVDFKGGTTGQVLKKTSGTDLDVEWGTASSGLTLINTTSFSGVSSVSLNADTFTSTYDNYRLLTSIQGSASSILNLRFRASGADNTTANYSYASENIDTLAQTNTLTGSGQTTIQMFYTTISPRTHFVIDIFNPKATLTTNFTGSAWGLDAAAQELGIYTTGGHFGLTTSFDALSFYPTSGTITGNYSIYGYSK